jgi:signal transduction histidine kinase
LPYFHPNTAWQQILSDGRSLLLFWLLGLWAAVGSAYLTTAWAGLRGALSRRLIAPRPNKDVDARLAELTQSRARIVDAYEAERRRMERDLHDGVQQRLTALILTIGLAEMELTDGPRPASTLIERAHREAKQALQELRDLVHHSMPALLEDRGLGAAVEALAEQSFLPVYVNVDLARRLPQAVESAAYFFVSEGLANVGKHSQGTRATVKIRQTQGMLTVEVCDDGIGGAHPTASGGLAGLRDRISAVGGVVELSSPPGGPTVLRAQIPCAS